MASANVWLPPIRGAAVNEDDPLSWPRAAGRMDGQFWAHDPKAALEARGCSVCLVTPGRMAGLRGRRCGEKRCAGYYVEEDWPDKPTVFVDVTLSERQQLLTMAHELAHMGHSTWNEAMCEAYAHAFMED